MYLEKDKHKTKVRFLYHEKDKHIFAFFPAEKWGNTDNGVFTSYTHIGQHSACHIDYANECIDASPEQYNDLKNELLSIGYNLEIIN